MPTRNLGVFAHNFLMFTLLLPFEVPGGATQVGQLEEMLLIIWCTAQVLRRLSLLQRSPYYSGICRSGQWDRFSVKADKADVSTGVSFLQKPH